MRMQYGYCGEKRSHKRSLTLDYILNLTSINKPWGASRHVKKEKKNLVSTPIK